MPPLPDQIRQTGSGSQMVSPAVANSPPDFLVADQMAGWWQLAACC